MVAQRAVTPYLKEGFYQRDRRLSDAPVVRGGKRGVSGDTFPKDRRGELPRRSPHDEWARVNRGVVAR